MDLRDVLHAVRYGWWLLLNCVLLGLVVAAGLSWTATPLYASSVQFFVSATDRPDAESAEEWAFYSEQRTRSYASTLRSQELAGRVVDELGLDLSAAQVARKVTAVAVPNTVVLQATVTDSSAARARDIAAALGRQFTRWVGDAETPVGAVASRVAVTTIQPATLPARAVSPDVALIVGLGGSVGLLLGLGMIVSSHRSWNMVTTEADVQHLTGAALIGAIPAATGSGSEPPVASERVSAQATRGIQANLRLLDAGGQPRVMVVAGLVLEDDAWDVAYHLADAVASAGARVALVDADVRSAERAPFLDRAACLGLADVLAGAASVPEVEQQLREGRLSVVPAGDAPAGLDQLLDSPQMRATLDFLRSTHDHVIVHAPSVGSIADATVLGDLTDGCLLVVGHGGASRASVAELAGAVSRSGVRFLGVVLTRVPAAVTVVRNSSYRYRADSDRAAVTAIRRAVMASSGPSVVGLPDAASRGDETS